jgi:hypothetical protein
MKNKIETLNCLKYKDKIQRTKCHAGNFISFKLVLSLYLFITNMNKIPYNCHLRLLFWKIKFYSSQIQKKKFKTIKIFR